MHGYLSADNVCSKMRTVFEHIFAKNIDYGVYHPSNIFNARENISTTELTVRCEGNFLMSVL